MQNENTPANARNVPVFFYGSFINRDVLARVAYEPKKIEVARLDGFDITARPLATLSPSNRDCVYGILTTATHADLQRLYGEGWVRSYMPEAVLVTTQDGAVHPALCYISWSPTSDAPFDQYLDHIIQPAEKLGFPKWYIERLRRLQQEGRVG